MSRLDRGRMAHRGTRGRGIRDWRRLEGQASVESTARSDVNQCFRVVVETGAVNARPRWIDHLLDARNAVLRFEEPQCRRVRAKSLVYRGSDEKVDARMKRCELKIQQQEDADEEMEEFLWRPSCVCLSLPKFWLQSALQFT